MTMIETKELPHIVIDLGSDTIKCGFNCENVPRFEIPNVIGHYKKNAISLINSSDKSFCGENALYNGSSLALHYPKSDNNGKFNIDANGIKDIESIFEYIFENKFNVNQESYNVFIIDSLFSPVKERGEIAKVLFETFRLYNIHFQPQEIMSLYSTSKTSGLIVNSGEIETCIVPIYQGYIIPVGINTSPLAGKTLTKKFENKYKNIFDINNVNNHFWMAKKIKECYAELLPDSSQMNQAKNEEYTLPDGNKMEIGIERYQIPEIIFNPSIINIDSKNLPELIYDSINKCDISTRKELFNNIILVGGNTMIKGFTQRFKNEFEKLNTYQRSYKILDTKERKYSAWIGASGVCSLGDFFDKWINRNSYFDYGEKIFQQNYLFNYEAFEKLY